MTIFLIDDAGPKGLSSAQFSKTLGIRKLDTRGQIKTLERKGLVQTYMKHDGRQKTAYYVAKRYQIKDPVPYIVAEPLPSNILEWHYVVTGPPDSPYNGGFYHGKVN